MEVTEENGAYILESVNGGEFYEDPNIMWIEVIIILLFYLLKSNTVLWVNVGVILDTISSLTAFDLVCIGAKLPNGLRVK